MKRRLFMLTSPFLFGLLCLWLLWPGNMRVQAAQVDDRLVMKEAHLSLTVADTSTAVATAINLAESYGGYVLNQRQWETGNTSTYGELTFGVPADQFEALLNALRTLGMVEDEQLSGVDVLATAVDLQSRLDNLTINQTRLRTLLDHTRNTTETLEVHQQLLRVENEINDLQGELNFYNGRSAAALITLNLTALLPTPTPTPLPTPQSWSAANTAKLASVRAQENAQAVANFAIYRGIIWGPWLIFLGLIGLGVARLRRRAAPIQPPRRTLPPPQATSPPKDE
ncbi:DUF4349 domain-containing protein [Candidatus Leptofilum sp.]|uniref:DUF4349 domain-containing protein n=1 Tax=Candidatus Leptofilum sp. TaxID=3241576 RepID=UPI003B5BDFB0